ncbi:MAG: hypothetical protein AAF674_12315 [Pseudomonadota bacterium]
MSEAEIPSPCSFCKSIVEKAIGGMPSDLTCGAASAAIGAAIAAAGEGNPLSDVAGAVAAVIIEKECDKYGWPWVKDHKKDVAEAICKAAKLC